jgi:hypothetical protein
MADHLQHNGVLCLTHANQRLIIYLLTDSSTLIDPLGHSQMNRNLTRKNASDQ